MKPTQIIKFGESLTTDNILSETMQLKCPKCSCEFIVDGEQCMIDYHRLKDNSIMIHKTFVCPWCFEHISISSLFTDKDKFVPCKSECLEPKRKKKGYPEG